MHNLAYVLIPPNGDVEEHVDRFMEPHVCEYDSGLCDYYSIGGRFSGCLGSGVNVSTPEIAIGRIPCAVIHEGGRLESCRYIDGKMVDTENYRERALDLIRSHSGRVVAVDYHN